MESRKMVPMNLFAEQKQRCKHRGETCGHSREKRGWDELRVALKYIPILPYEKQIVGGNLLCAL